MTKERSLELGYQNMEVELSKIIREEPYFKVTKAYIERGVLKMVFEPEDRKKYPSYVKQVSKKKYCDMSKFFTKVFRQGGLLTCVLETPKMWIMFFEKN